MKQNARDKNWITAKQNKSDKSDVQSSLERRLKIFVAVVWKMTKYLNKS